MYLGRVTETADRYELCDRPLHHSLERGIDAGTAIENRRELES